MRSIINEEKPISVLHVPFSPSGDPSPALGVNNKVRAAEVVFFYFPSTLSRGERETVMSSVIKIRPVMECSNALAVYDGWTLEETVPNPGPQASDGEMSQVYMNLVGWTDVEAHAKFSNSEDFQQNIYHLLGIKEIRHTELFHVRLHAV